MIKKVTLLLVAAGIAVIAVFVQHFTSNDNPTKKYCNINNKVYCFKLTVYHEGKDGSVIEINIPDTAVTGVIFYKSLKANDIWISIKMIRLNETLITMLPNQKPNDKLQYYIELKSVGRKYFISQDNPVIVRFQNEVPKFILYPQIVLIFLALIFSCYVGLLVIFNIETYKKYSVLTFYLMLAGALILNLIVNLISFKSLFIKIEATNDLTLYRNLIIFLFWLLLFYVYRKKENRFVTFVISFVTLLFYCLPQSILFGWLIK